MDGANPPRIWFGHPGTVDFVFQPARNRPIGFQIRSRVPLRRHRAGTQLCDDALPNLSVGTGIRRIQRVERKSGRSELLVMTSDAIFVENSSRSNGVRRGWILRGRSMNPGQKNENAGPKDQCTDRYPLQIASSRVDGSRNYRTIFPDMRNLSKGTIRGSRGLDSDDSGVERER